MGEMKNLYTIGFTDTTLNLVNKAINLLKSDYVWSEDFEQIKPVLLSVLVKYDETSIVLATILMRE
jgi:hypothetical protein